MPASRRTLRAAGLTPAAAAPARLRVGIVGAGRVGAVLGAALAAAGHDVVAAAGLSAASAERAARLLPGVPLLPTDEVVAAADLVVLAVPDDTLPGLVAGLAETGVWRARPADLPHLRRARPGRARARRAGRRAAARAAPGDDVHRHPRGRRPAGRRPLRRDQPPAAPRRRRDPGPRDGRRAVLRRRGRPAAVPRRPGHRRQPPGHPGRRGRRPAARRPASPTRPACSAPLLTAALDNGLRRGDRGLTGPVSRGDVGTVADHLRDAHRARARSRSPPTSPWPSGRPSGRWPPAGSSGTRAPRCSTCSTDAARRRPGRLAVSAVATCPAVAESVADLRRLRAALPGPVALVPTMGALHEGHRALVRAARERAASVVVSVFVNPTQFGPGEDFDRYPRTWDADLAALAEEGADLVFHPEVDDVYPPGALGVTVDPGPLGVGARGRGPARPLRRRADRRRQAVRPGPARPRAVRREGLPAAHPDPRAWRGSWRWASRSSACRPSARTTAWRCPAATATSTREQRAAAATISAALRAGAAAGPRRRRRRARRRPRGAGRRADARSRTTSSSPTPIWDRRPPPARPACWSPPAPAPPDCSTTSAVDTSGDPR